MTERDRDEDLAALVAELVTALEDLEAELDPPRERGLRPPTPRELRRLTSEVAIPGIILVLETNVRALRLLQRALEVSESADRARDDAAAVGERAREVRTTTLDKLEDALADLEAAVEGRPPEDEAARLLADARELRSEVQRRLDEYAADARERHSGAEERTDDPEGAADESESEDTPDADHSSDESETPQVDVDAELESIKRDLDDGDDGHAGSNGSTDETDGSDGPTDGSGAPEGEGDGTGDESDGPDGTS